MRPIVFLEETNIRSSKSFLSTVVLPEQVRLKPFLEGGETVSHCGYMDSNYWLIRTEIELSLSCKHLNSNNCGPTTIRSTPRDNSVRVD